MTVYLTSKNEFSKLHQQNVANTDLLILFVLTNYHCRMSTSSFLFAFIIIRYHDQLIYINKLKFGDPF